VRRGLISPGKRQISVPGGGSTLTHHHQTSNPLLFVPDEPTHETEAEHKAPCRYPLFPHHGKPAGLGGSLAGWILWARYGPAARDVDDTDGYLFGLLVGVVFGRGFVQAGREVFRPLKENLSHRDLARLTRLHTADSIERLQRNVSNRGSCGGSLYETSLF